MSRYVDAARCWNLIALNTCAEMNSFSLQWIQQLICSQETTDRRRRHTVSDLNGSVAERGRTDMYS